MKRKKIASLVLCFNSKQKDLFSSLCYKAYKQQFEKWDNINRISFWHGMSQPLQNRTNFCSPGPIGKAFTDKDLVSVFTSWLTFFGFWFLFLFFLIFFSLYLFLREKDRVRAGEEQRERETQNPKQAPGSKLSARLEPTNREIMTWAEVGRLTDWATQAPLHPSFIISVYT